MRETITVSIPDMVLSGNSVAHWGKKIKPKKAAREEGYYAALASKLKHARYKEADVHMVFYHKVTRVRDGDNFLILMKHTLDGFADAEIVVNDKGFKHYPIQFKIDKENPRVEITIEEVKN
tara:strand:- start:45 stop:407 length:363 start_codon:yes stop_codon:yes gene_type:complete